MRYKISVPKHLASVKKPLKSEFYGPCWEIVVFDDDPRADPVAIIPDPGDGSAAPLARRVLALLNGDCGEGSGYHDAKLAWDAARAAFVADVREKLECDCDYWHRRNRVCPWHDYAVKILTEEEFKSC